MLHVFTDGATVGHNGKLGTVSEVGLGVYISEKDIRLSKRTDGISNNEAEFKALIYGMEYCLEHGLDQCLFLLDSRIVVNRAHGRKPTKVKYKNSRMDAFQDEVLDLATQFESIGFMWIPREENQVADSLSKSATYEI